MRLTPKIDVLGAALADLRWARMLCQMMDGRAFTGKELAGAAGITAQTASAHLRKLQGARMLVARSCYDHLARCLGVAIATALVKRGALLPGGRGKGRPFAPACLD